MNESASPAPPAVVVEHDAARSRFRAVVDGFEGVAEYRLDGGVLRMTHTEVPAALEGRGVAAALVREAFAHAGREGLKVQPLCSYVRGWVRRHPEVRPLLA